jgi:hypothetical protein
MKNFGANGRIGAIELKDRKCRCFRILNCSLRVAIKLSFQQDSVESEWLSLFRGIKYSFRVISECLKKVNFAIQNRTERNGII